MQTNIFSLIEELVSMSGSSNDFDTLNSELSILEIEIPKIKEEIDELASSMTEDKYFDASQEIVDRNIELSVSKKLSKLEKEFRELQEKHEELQIKEKESVEAVDDLNKKINKTKRTISAIGERMENAKEEKTKEIYTKVLEEENNKIKFLHNKLEEKNKILESVLSEVDLINDAIEKLKIEIEQSTSRLMEVRKNLINRKCYTDEILKRKDKDSLETLKNKLEDYETKKLNILTDASYIASEIKDLFINEENDKALKKLLELVTIVNAKPYMNISDITRLEEELEKLEKEQNELINMIENKEYFGSDVKYLDDRIAHLYELIEAKKAKIEEIKDEIDRIDNKMVINITNELKKAESEAYELEKSINNYHELIKNDDKKHSNTLVALQVTYNKKNGELNVINDIIDRYSKELHNLIETSSNLENECIKRTEIEIKEYENEIEELNKIKTLSTKTKDAIEQENDKRELKKVSENITMLKQRIRFNKTAQEIYDQIEMILTTKETSVTNSEITTPAMELSENVESNIEEQAIGENDEVGENVLFKNFESQKELHAIENEENNINLEKENIMAEKELDNIGSDVEKTLFDDFDFFDSSDTSKAKEHNNPNEMNLANDKPETVLNNAEDEYTFSELEDTDYFSLDEFLKNLESQKEE